jgi:hypothetical protein
LSIRADDSGTQFLGHGGSVAGYAVHMLFQPWSKLVVVPLRNYGRGATNLSRAAAGFLADAVTAAAAR